MTALFFYLFIALFVSFVCSLTESVLLSVPQSYLATIKDRYHWANSFLSYKQKIDKPLSAKLSKIFSVTITFESLKSKPSPFASYSIDK